MKAFQAPFIDDSAVYLPASSMLSDDTDYVCFSELVQFKREATAEEEEQVSDKTLFFLFWEFYCDFLHQT